MPAQLLSHLSPNRGPLRFMTALLWVLGGAACHGSTSPSAERPADPARPATEVVYYRDFGAVGDGRTDDFDAIIAAHHQANSRGWPVRAEDGATYYIGAGKRTAEIRTNTDFGTAAFMIDDREVKLEERRTPVFKVVSDHAPIKLKNVAGFRKDQAKIQVSLPMRSLVIPVDSGTKRYIRRGGNQNAGNSQEDVLLVDPDGTIDPSTPPFWDFDTITEFTAYPVDTTPLTIRGGRFTTIANQAPSNYTYFFRGLDVERSRVTVEGLTHLVTGEGDTGAPYAGFLNIFRSSDVVVRNCVFTARKTYRTIGPAGVRVSMGSYDFSVHRSVNVSFIGCTQTTDLQDNTRWWIMASNGSKNLLYDGCVLSRFDAHSGLFNATIRNSTVKVIAVTGQGTLRIENSTIPHHRLIGLRDDYGSTWAGEVIIRDCVLAPPAASRDTPVTIFHGQNDGLHDFGYPCSMPGRIVIDGLKIMDNTEAAGREPVFVFWAKFGQADAPHPYLLTKEIITSRLSTESGRPVILSNEPDAFKDTRWIQK